MSIGLPSNWTMVPYTLASGPKMVIGTERVSKYGQTAPNMKASGFKIESMVLVDSFMLMVIIMRAYGKMVKPTVEVFI